MWLDDHRTALYRFFDADGALLYIGITVNVEQRWAEHERSKPWWPQVVEKRVEWFDTRTLALIAELAAIKGERPVHNVAGAPGAYEGRPLAANEVRPGTVRAQFTEYVERARYRGEVAVIVDRTRERKPAAVLVSFDFYVRACEALGEERVLVTPES